MQHRNSEIAVSKMLLAVGLALLALSAGRARGQEEPECEPPLNADMIQMAIDGVYPTYNMEVEGITEAMLEEQMDGERKAFPKDYKEFLDEQDDFQKDVDKDKEAFEFGKLPPKKDDDSPGSLAHQAYEYYKPACPSSYYILRKYQWYFFYSGDNYRKYCWPYHDVWASHCWYRYCNWNHEFTTIWTHFHRCFNYYRTIWVYSRCLTINDETGTLSWSNEFVRRKLPRGCSCHRIAYPFAIDRQCPTDA